MSIVTLRVYEVVESRYDNYNYSKPPTNKVKTDKLSKDHTYIAIFSNGQNRSLKCLEESKDIKILHKAAKAVNKTPYHGKTPRNTLVVFELA
jgi:hypothetical protein